MVVCIEGRTEADELKSLKRRAADLNRDDDWGTEAIELNTMIVQLDPEDLAAYSRRGKCYYRRGDLEEAEADYQSALALCSEGASVISHIRQAISDIRAEVEERAEKARTEKKERYRAEQARREKLERQQQLLSSLGSCDEAVTVARDARYGDDPDPGFVLAAYRRAAELDPERLDVGVEWAALLRELNYHERASKLYERILNQQPDHRAARVGKAALLVDAGGADEGLAICEAILLDHPTDGYARKVKARAHAARGEMPEAVWQYESAG